MRALAMSFVLALAGCQATTTAQAEVQDVADAYCQCVEPSDRTCPGNFAQQLGSAVSDQCEQCVFDHEHTCASLITDCIPLCTPTTTTPGGP